MTRGRAIKAGRTVTTVPLAKARGVQRTRHGTPRIITALVRGLIKRRYPSLSRLPVSNAKGISSCSSKATALWADQMWFAQTVLFNHKGNAQSSRIINCSQLLMKFQCTVVTSRKRGLVCPAVDLDLQCQMLWFKALARSCMYAEVSTSL